MNDNVKKSILIVGLTTIFLIAFFTSFTLTSNAFYQAQKTVTGQIILGKANVFFTNEQLDARVKVGENISYEVSVVNANNASATDTKGLIDCYLRVKTDITSNGENVNVITLVPASNDWMEHTDGYLYYKPIFKVGSMVPIFSELNVASEISQNILEQGVQISIFVETVQTGANVYKNLWTTAPSIW